MIVITVQLQPNKERKVSMTKKGTIASAIAILTLSTMLMAAQMPGSPATKEAGAAPGTLTGIVSDSMCGAHHMAKDKGPAECTRTCVKQGMKYALVVGKKVYTLEGHEAELDKFAGKKATVKGKVSGETITIESVAVAKGTATGE